MRFIDKSNIQYRAKIPEGILKNVPTRTAEEPVERSINGPTYSAEEFRPAYWDEQVMPSEYRPKNKESS